MFAGKVRLLPYAGLGLLKLVGYAFTLRLHRLDELLRPYPICQEITFETLVRWHRDGKKFILTSVPFNNWHEDGRPALTNVQSARLLADLVGRNATLMGRVFTQQEIAETFTALTGLVLEKRQVLRPETRDAWVQTDKFYEQQAVMFARKLYGDELSDVTNVIVGFSGHVQRCKLVAIGQDLTDSLVARVSLRNRIFDRLGGQVWCTRAVIWWPFEYTARLILLGQGKI